MALGTCSVLLFHVIRCFRSGRNRRMRMYAYSVFQYVWVCAFEWANSFLQNTMHNCRHIRPIIFISEQATNLLTNSVNKIRCEVIRNFANISGARYSMTSFHFSGRMLQILKFWYRKWRGFSCCDTIHATLWFTASCQIKIRFSDFISDFLSFVDNLIAIKYSSGFRANIVWSKWIESL